MKILLVGSFRYEMYAPAFAYGFSQLGCDVVNVDYEKYHLKGSGIICSLHNRIQDRYHCGIMIRRYNQDIIKIVQKESPDIVFLYRCYHVYNNTLKTIRNKTVLISYNNDDPFSEIPSKSYYRNHIANSSFCHINYVYRCKNIEDYAKLGINNTKILLPYYLSWQNKPICCEKDIDVLYIGHYEDDGRDYCINRLIEEGINVHIYGGSSWEKSKYYCSISTYFHGEAFGDKYNQLLNRARIILVFFSKHNHDTYTRRCFEIPATKGVMLSEYTKDMDNLYPENECAVYFRNPNELVNKCKKLIPNIADLERISQNAFNRLQVIGGSEIDRVKEIIDDYNLTLKLDI